jgi:hypothetical protein
MIQLENQLTDFDEIWYGSYAAGGYLIHLLFLISTSIIPTWQMNELVRWE